MSEAAPLQFGKAEFAGAPAQATCTACQSAIGHEYFEINGAVVCTACREQLAQLGTQGSRSSRFLRALAAGAAAGAVGSLIYFGISKLTGYEFGLIAVLVGFGVGGAVRWGCYGRGGRLYQALAVALTYFAIVSTYVPDVIEGIRQSEAIQASESAPADAGAAAVVPVANQQAEAIQLSLGGVVVAFVIVLLIAAVAPFLTGIQNIIGLVIVGVGLWEAWKMNQRPVLIITGPHAVASPAPAAAV